ncbi:hypothetical protein SOVF_110620 [Spinacia oleracea]|uniref:UBP1-associated protein 2A n=1 Tax=Spinacia oleracea TaxID=3562 RepID=A0A9R0JF30_SPIOL|nr:UBP1-associated protein 2A-like [Spinacia oleracea]KNA14114.1 hypothetical protein SOVF_110620 [Spinacia oleracea]
MEDMKKRKLDEVENGLISPASGERLRSLLEPLAKPQLVDLLVKLGSTYSPVAGEIMSLASADPVHRKLFVRGLAWNTTSETLCAAFIGHGEIEEGAVITDKATGKSRGYGFITYKNMDSAQDALKASSKLIDGRLTVCNLACEGLSSASTAPDQAQRKLYIGGLSPEITTEMLLSFFSRHGEIDEGSVAYDKDTNKSRGFGFVTYKTVDSAKKALDDPERTLGGRNITVKFADTKNKTTPSQFSSTPVPMIPPNASGYQQPGKAQAPLGYSYPQHMPSYPPVSTYTNPPAAAAPLPAMTPGQYPQGPQPSQVSYAPPPMKDTFGMPHSMPVGMSGYPYYSYMGKP